MIHIIAISKGRLNRKGYYLGFIYIVVMYAVLLALEAPYMAPPATDGPAQAISFAMIFIDIISLIWLLNQLIRRRVHDFGEDLFYVGTPINIISSTVETINNMPLLLKALYKGGTKFPNNYGNQIYHYDPFFVLGFRSVEPPPDYDYQEPDEQSDK